MIDYNRRSSSTAISQSSNRCSVSLNRSQHSRLLSASMALDVSFFKNVIDSKPKSPELIQGLSDVDIFAFKEEEYAKVIHCALIGLKSNVNDKLEQTNYLKEDIMMLKTQGNRLGKIMDQKQVSKPNTDDPVDFMKTSTAKVNFKVKMKAIRGCLEPYAQKIAPQQHQETINKLQLDVKFFPYNNGYHWHQEISKDNKQKMMQMLRRKSLMANEKKLQQLKIEENSLANQIKQLEKQIKRIEVNVKASVEYNITQEAKLADIKHAYDLRTTEHLSNLRQLHQSSPDYEIVKHQIQLWNKLSELHISEKHALLRRQPTYQHHLVDLNREVKQLGVLIQAEKIKQQRS